MRSMWRTMILAALIAVGGAPASAEHIISYKLDFTDHNGEAVEEWLAAKGFALEADTDNQHKVDLTASADGLVVEVKRNARALLVDDSRDIPDAGKIRITWKVDRYPEGANYDAGVRNEALMVMVFFGDEHISSGSWVVPDSPYFIGMFLCKEGAVGTAYIGRYFKEGGRYVCLDRPNEGDVVTSEFDLSAAFKKYFNADDVPVISGLAIQADTTDSDGGGKARASIASVAFIKND